MSITRTALALSLMAFGLGAVAQTHVEESQKMKMQSHKYVMFGDGDSDSIQRTKLIEQFYEDQFRHAQDPQAPYFLLMSRDSKVAMGVGGNITGIASYDWHGMIDGDGFNPYNIAIPANHARPNAFQTSIGNSSLFLTVFGNNDKIGMFKFYIQAKFAGGGDSHYFKLKNAYATAGDWTVGYTLSTFTDPAAQPSTVETAGPNSEPSDRRVLLRYMHTFKKSGLTLALSIENPENTYITNEYTAEGNVYVPDFSGFLQYSWAKGQHIRAAGIVKSIRYRDLVEQRNRYTTGWGVALSTVFNPCREITVYGSGYYGHGIGNNINDLACGDNDVVAMASEPGIMKNTKSYGWYAALQYNFSPKLFTTLIVSQERILPQSGMAYGGDQYKYGLYGVANVFYNITPRWQVGAEIDLGKRANINGDHRMAYRACCLAQFNF